MTKSIDELLENFAEFLNRSWNSIASISESDPTGSLKDDWLQANWEIIVEGMLGDRSIFLVPYGDGADCNGASSRVLFPHKLETHSVVITPQKGNTIYDYLNKKSLDTSSEGIVFDKFVCMDEDGWYYERPPFNFLFGEHLGKRVVVLRNDSTIKLIETKKPNNRSFA